MNLSITLIKRLPLSLRLAQNVSTIKKIFKGRNILKHLPYTTESILDRSTYRWGIPSTHVHYTTTGHTPSIFVSIRLLLIDFSCVRLTRIKVTNFSNHIHGKQLRNIVCVEALLADDKSWNCKVYRERIKLFVSSRCTSWQ